MLVGYVTASATERTERATMVVWLLAGVQLMLGIIAEVSYCLRHPQLNGSALHRQRLDRPDGALSMVRSSVSVSLLCALCVALGFSDAVAQDAIVRGIVVDDETGDPLAGVNVFLSQTMIGGVTDSGGLFEIRRVPPGAYEIVASMVGFERDAEPLEVIPEITSYDVPFRLSPVVAEMDGVEIIAERPRGWRRNFRRFERLFIGTGPNAGETEIANPFVLDFEERDGTFFASASEPLEIINRALGYEIAFVLSDFRFDRTAELLYMHGPFHFRELEANDSSTANRWLENRARTYLGSLQHVLESLIRHRTLSEGISVKLDNREDAPYSKEEPFLKSIEGLALIKRSERPYLHSLEFPDYLYVTYRDDRSWIELNRGAATIHESGYVYAPAGAPGLLTVYGSLANRRVSDLLPREYRWSAHDPSE